ncbi:hypothetical protein OAH77_04390 [Flavobacteriaceae bacterium]|nr:hypothetical protein [Flavobacteriaceae bacterium]
MIQVYSITRTKLYRDLVKVKGVTVLRKTYIHPQVGNILMHGMEVLSQECKIIVEPLWEDEKSRLFNITYTDQSTGEELFFESVKNRFVRDFVEQKIYGRLAK